MSENPNYPIVCPIWGTIAVQPRPAGDGRTFYDSPRAGGKFSMARPTESDINENPHSMLRSVDASVKARLTSWLIEQRHRQKEEFPEVTCDSIRNAQARRPLRVAEIADNFLRYLAQLGNGFGSKFLPPYSDVDDENHLKALSHLENIPTQKNDTSNEQIKTYMRYLKEKSWIGHDSTRETFSEARTFEVYLTIDGYSRLEELNYTSSSSTQAFMAMWFNPSMYEAWRSGFEPGIREAGYDPVRIDQKEHPNKIDDEMIAEIRRSRFMVADFTQWKREARGNVYYEAGFAHGLGIPVIFTCRTDCCERIQFDIRQYSRIKWDYENLEKLQVDLANRITAILGDGPGKQTI